MEAEVIYLWPLFFSNIDVQCYKLLPKYCFSSILEILICCFSLSLNSRYFLISDFFFDSCVISFPNIGGFFFFFFRDLSVINSVWAETLNDFKLLNLLSLVLWPKIWSILVNAQCTHKSTGILLFGGGLFYKYQSG